MNRCLVLVSFLLLPAARAADPPDPVAAVQAKTRRVIEAGEPSVVAVVVSRTPYRGQSPEDVARGRLGSYTPPDPARSRGWLPVIPPEIRKLDLSDPGNVANHSFGSGIVLSNSGHVLTNYHLIDGATKVYCRGAGGRGGYADIFAADARSDLAVLKVNSAPTEWKPATLADARFVDGPHGKATVRKGDFVVALAHAQAAGFPDGSPSASFGVISNVGRRTLGRTLADNDRVAQPLYKLGSLIQTDARLSVGVSGGALFDLDGKVIGLTSSVAAVAGSEASGGYAIPFDTNYRRIIAALKEGKEVEYGFLGVSTELNAGDDGAVLARVTPGTPADKAGLRGNEAGPHSGDRIVAVDGNPIKNMDDLFLHVGAALAGSVARVTVRRGLDTRDLDVTLAKFRNPQPWLAANRPAPVFGLRVDHTSVLLQDLIQAQDRMVGYAALPRGVVIREVEPGSPAEAALKQTGEDASRWVITKVNDSPVNTPEEFYEKTKGKAVVKLGLVHTAEMGKTREVTLR